MCKKYISLFYALFSTLYCFGGEAEIFTKFTLLDSKVAESDFVINCLVGNRKDVPIFFGELTFTVNSILDSNDMELLIGGGSTGSSRTFVLLEPNRSRKENTITTDASLIKKIPVKISGVIINPAKDTKLVNLIKGTVQARYFLSGSSDPMIFEKTILLSRHKNGNFVITVKAVDRQN